MKEKSLQSRYAKEVIDALEEQLADELTSEDVDLDAGAAPAAPAEAPAAPAEDGDVVPIEENDDEILNQAEEMLEGLEAEGEAAPEGEAAGAAADDAEAAEILASCDKLETAIEAAELEKEIDAIEAGEDDCPECKERQGCPTASRKASTVKPGIEDEIGDQGRGGEPSVSKLPKLSDPQTITLRQYVFKLTGRLDRVAKELEARGNRRMAFRIDQLSDALEASVRGK